MPNASGGWPNVAAGSWHATTRPPPRSPWPRRCSCGVGRSGSHGWRRRNRHGRAPAGRADIPPGDRVTASTPPGPRRCGRQQCSTRHCPDAAAPPTVRRCRRRRGRRTRKRMEPESALERPRRALLIAVRGDQSGVHINDQRVVRCGAVAGSVFASHRPHPSPSRSAGSVDRRQHPVGVVGEGVHRAGDRRIRRLCMPSPTAPEGCTQSLCRC